MANAASRSARASAAPHPPAPTGDGAGSAEGPGEAIIDLRDAAPPDPAAAATTAATTADRGADPAAAASLEPTRGGAPPRLRYAHRSKRQWVVVAAVAVAAVSLLRLLVVGTAVVTTDAMTPTLAEGDRVVVSKLSYRLGEVDRGDLVVFDHPDAEGDGAPLIRRVVGLPGETVAIEESGVVVDGTPLEEPFVPVWLTYVPEDPVTVPDGHVYVLCDNRARYADSRSFGPVPVDDLVGRVAFHR